MIPRVECPTCHRRVEWSAANPFRPFCSERCRLVDLGAWFSGARAIPDESTPELAHPEDDAAPQER